MYYQQIQAPPPPPQHSANNGGGCLICTVVICGAIQILVTIYTASIENYLIWQLLGGGTLVLFLLVTKHQREKQLQQEQAYQRYLLWVQYDHAQRAWLDYQHRQREAYFAEQARKEQEQRDRDRLARLSSLRALLSLTPYEFKDTVCKLLATHENLHDVQRVSGAGDLAADIIAYGKANNLIIVQCKKYAPDNKVSSPEIQKFIGMMQVHHQTKSGIFVTTSTFTQPAIELAEKHNILLIDGEHLVNMVRNRLT